MKKIKGLIAVMLICLFVFPTAVFAAGGTVDTFDATADNNKITVSGKVTGIFACAVCVYDETGTTLKVLETCQVKSDNTYSYTLQDTFADGKYMVTIADYNGGTASTKMIEVKGDVQTGDTTQMPLYFVLIGVCGTAFVLASKKKKVTE